MKKSHKNELLPTIFKTKLQRSDPRVVNAMAKYAVGKNLTFAAVGSATNSVGDSVNTQVSSKKSARLLATAIYYSLKQVCSRFSWHCCVSNICWCINKLESIRLV